MTRLIPLALALLTIVPVCARAEVTYPDRPGEREFILDRADLVTDAHEERIREICDTLLTEKRLPIVVVTIGSLSDYGAGHLSIEEYAFELFNRWGIGSPEYNYGILLLIARRDRKARIELGAEWGRSFDGTARRIMDYKIIPRFKEGEFSRGIVDGVVALDLMARDEEIPMPNLAERTARQASSLWDRLVGWVASLGGLLIYILALPFFLIARLFGFGGRGGYGGGFSGGSFGGGFSGGGGATGSW